MALNPMGMRSLLMGILQVFADALNRRQKQRRGTDILHEAADDGDGKEMAVMIRDGFCRRF
jgi:hypothetical protein